MKWEFAAADGWDFRFRRGPLGSHVQESRVDWKELRRSRRALLRFVLVGVALAVLAWMVPATTLGDRIKVAAVGAAIIALGVLRPSGAWDAPRGAGLRWLFGDRGTQVVIVTIGSAWALAALLGLI
jgi:hypothetical protein